MEQKRRTMSTTGARKKKGKKVWKVLGVIVALGLIFFLSYKISYGLLSDGSNPSTDATQSTEEDIASMTREELEKSYKDAKKQLEEKDAECSKRKFQKAIRQPQHLPNHPRLRKPQSLRNLPNLLKRPNRRKQKKRRKHRSQLLLIQRLLRQATARRRRHPRQQRRLPTSL